LIIAKKRIFINGVLFPVCSKIIGMMYRVFLGILTIVIAACQSSSAPDDSALEMREVYLVSPGGNALTITAEIADTPEKQRTGLMHRQSLDPDKGMLFVFDRAFPLSFWMKNTLIPLDILFFDGDMQLVSTKNMYPCTYDTCPYTRSDAPAKFALEVVSGFIAEHEIVPGWRLVYE
jgi:uncharacterized protein